MTTVRGVFPLKHEWGVGLRKHNCRNVRLGKMCYFL